MLLLLLAIAQLRFGSPERSSRDHVLILDTSAWMDVRTGTSAADRPGAGRGAKLCQAAARPATA